MKKYCYLFLISMLLFSSCSFGLRNKLNQADEVKIQFYGYNDDGSFIVLEKILTDHEEIKEFSNFISARPAPSYKCGYNGEISFYKDNKEIFHCRFNICKDCAYCSCYGFLFPSNRFLTSYGYNYLRPLYETIDEKYIR